MGYIKIFILTLLCNISLQAASIDSEVSKQEFMVKVFESIVTNNSSTYKTYLLKETILKDYIVKTKKLSNLSEDQDKELNAFVKDSHKEYLEEELRNFKKVQLTSKKINIIWSNVSLDSVSFEKTTNYGFESFSGSFYFKNKDNSEFFKMNFAGLLFDSCFQFEKTNTPFVDIGAKNRLATATLKKPYIENCVKLAQEFIDNYPNKFISEATFGNCPRCYCEKQYLEETEQSDGIERIKQNKLNFKLPDEYKKKGQ